jgi:hypothetical protein
MKIAVYQDELYIPLADHRAVSSFDHTIEVPDEWAERYFAAKAEFERMTGELDARWNAALTGSPRRS